MSTFKRRPTSSVQILLALADEEIVPEEGSNGNLSGHYEMLQARLAELGVEIKEGQTPEEMYREAARHFKRSKSTYHSESDLIPVQKMEVEAG